MKCACPSIARLSLVTRNSRAAFAQLLSLKEIALMVARARYKLYMVG